MLVYVVLFVIILVMGLIQYSTYASYNIKLKKKNYSLATLILFCFVFIAITFVEANRSETVGEDLPGYLSYFGICRMQEINANTFLDFSAFEPGFVLLNKGIGMISATNHTFIVVTSIVIVFLNIYFLYKNSDDLYLSILLFFGFNHFFTSMVSLRQYIALGLVMWILPALNKKKYIGAIILSVVAFFFHMTSIIATFFIFLAYIVRNKKKLILWASVAVVFLMPIAEQLFLFFTNFIPKYRLYYHLVEEKHFGIVRYIYILLEITLIVYVYISKGNDEEYNEYSFLLIPAIACGVLTSLPHIFRVGYYFDYIMLLLIPKIVEDFKKNKRVMRVAVIIIATIFFVYYLSVNPGNTVPYDFY